MHRIFCLPISRSKLERFTMTRFLATLLASAALCASLPLRAHAELYVVSLKNTIERSVESDYPKLDALYKDIHAHPEIAFREEKTAAKLAAEMRALGFEVTEHVGKTGLVAIYKNGDGPTIMVRTELDALPMEEKTGLPYASHDKTIWQGRETFVAHSCGQDTGSPERAVARHADVHRPAGRRNRVGRQGHAGGWPVHAISKAQFRLCFARWSLRLWHRALSRWDRLIQL